MIFNTNYDLTEAFKEWEKENEDEEQPEEQPRLCYHSWKKEYVIGQFFLLRCSTCKEVHDGRIP